MELHQLRTFVTVAREGSITRASEKLYLSQPAVSAHIKAIEEGLGIALFDRTARGMVTTRDGERLLAKAEQILGAHQALISEAASIKGSLTGKLRVGGGSNSISEPLGRLMMGMSTRCPEVEITLKHGSAIEILDGLRNGELDVGFYNEPAEPDGDLVTLEVGRFSIYLAAPAGSFDGSKEPDWQRLGDLPWIFPTCGPSCCGSAAEGLFLRYQFRPKRVIGVDRESVTRTLIAGGVGIGMLHADTASIARENHEVDIVCEAHNSVRVMFANLASRANDPIISAARTVLSEKA